MEIKPTCSKCGGTGWYKYGHNHATICNECCLHSQGWWELTEEYAGYREGEDNACCRDGCGTMRRELAENTALNSADKAEKSKEENKPDGYDTYR